jgi:hypothetical protein
MAAAEALGAAVSIGILNGQIAQALRRGGKSVEAPRQPNFCAPHSVNEAALSSSYQGQHEPGDSPPLTLGDEIL